MSDAALAVGVSTTGVGASRLPNSHADRNESARKLPGRIFIWASRPIHGVSGDLATRFVDPPDQFLGSFDRLLAESNLFPEVRLRVVQNG